ncbi:MAG: HAD-IC family P-type ATPase, partial [Deferribacteraceae bacterium]|nr:HAD-IC family P-type ATPase [Deferribacteraceae bacterium]
MSKDEQRLLLRIILAVAIMIPAIPLHILGKIPAGLELPIFIVAYAIVAYDILYRAIRNFKSLDIFDENFLMSIATLGAFALGEYPEGVAVMLFYQVGELFQSYAVSKSRRNIADLMDIRPDYATVLRDGQYITVSPETINVGDIISVKPGERVPLDGIVTDGASSMDTSALTGESLPRDVAQGDSVIGGCINQTGRLTIEVTKRYSESTVAKILDMVENAASKKSRSEAFITRFARYYTPIVVLVALALATIAPLVTGQDFSVWVYRALTFLVISCPCALVISVPLSFFGGIGGASKVGVLVKGSNYLEALANTEIVVFDKTGTLTKGSFAVSEIQAAGMLSEQLLEYAALAEAHSTPPIDIS